MDISRLPHEFRYKNTALLFGRVVTIPDFRLKQPGTAGRLIDPLVDFHLETRTHRHTPD